MKKGKEIKKNNAPMNFGEGGVYGGTSADGVRIMLEARRRNKLASAGEKKPEMPPLECLDGSECPPSDLEVFGKKKCNRCVGSF